MQKRYLLSTITIAQIGALMHDAKRRLDERTVADCIRTVQWIDEGRKTRCKAARRVLRLLNIQRTKENAAETAKVRAKLQSVIDRKPAPPATSEAAQ